MLYSVHDSVWIIAITLLVLVTDQATTETEYDRKVEHNEKY